MPPDPREESVRELMDEAYEKLGELDYSGALKIGNQLKKMRYSGAFEIIALAYAAEDKIDKAVKCLKEGVKTCPDVWILWQMLGNYHSDLRMFDDAMQCYDTAARCSSANGSSISLNKAVCLSRQQKYEQALELLSRVEGEQMRYHVECVRLGCLVDLKRYDEVIAGGQSTTAEIGAAPEPVEKPQREWSGIYAALADAYFAGRKDVESARKAVSQAVTYDKTNESALKLIREMNNIKAQDSKMFWLLVNGIWDKLWEDDGKCPGFFTSYWVVASSPEEALDFAREIEPAGVRSSLKVDKYESQKLQDWQELKGVYKSRRYTFYTLPSIH